MKDLIAIRQAFKDYTFKEEGHEYFYKGKPGLTSTTSVLKVYTKPFNSGWWAQRKAIEYGVSVGDILKIWDEEKVYGVTRGDWLHNYMEWAEENKIFSPPSYKEVQHLLSLRDYNNLKKEFKTLVKYAEKFRKDTADILIPIKSELVVGNIDYGISGMIDRLYWSTELDGFVVYDWKTDKKLLDKSENNTKFKKPISHLPECELVKYSLQIGIYVKLFQEATGLEIKDRKVVWFNVNNDSYKVIDLLKLDAEVSNIIDNFVESKSVPAHDIRHEELLF